MKIGILPPYRERNLTGINRLTVGVLQEQLKIDRSNQYFFLGKTDWLPIDLEHIDIYIGEHATFPLSYTLYANQFDVIHSYFPPFLAGDRLDCGKILTIHDIRPLLHPEWDGQFMYIMFDEYIRKTALCSDVVIADSEYTKMTVVEYYHIREEKVKVVYPGLFGHGFVEEAVEVEGLSQEAYLLSVSSSTPNKNFGGLIEAFVYFKQAHSGNKVKLVIVGHKGNDPLVQELLVKYPQYACDIIFTGYVDDDQLVWLYKHAMAYICVSFFEGFGLPILEALSEGNAVICSDTTSMPEVGGDAAEYCNPYSVDSIVGAMENVLLHEERRRELQSRAKRQAAKFSYVKAAEETLKIYQTFM